MEIDRLKKSQALKAGAKDADAEEIRRPDGPIRLQDAMGLQKNRALYMTCRVSHFLEL